MLQFIALESQRSRLPQMAAALSYRTVFGILPMIVVALVALRFFVSDSQIDYFINRTLSYAGLEAIVLDEPPPEATGPLYDEEIFFREPHEPAPPPAIPASPPAEERPVVTPADVSRSELAETIRTLVDRAKQIDYRAIGLIGALTLIYAAVSMLTEIELAFNQIFQVPIGKPWRRRMAEYWAIITLGTPCLVATFFVGERAKAMVADAVESTGVSSGALGVVLAGYALTVLISAALLFLAYTLLPNTRVRLVPAIAGALLAAVLWEAGKWGFTQYIRYSTGYAKLYGSIALIPLFLLWIYATWAIVLFGLQVTYQIQQARAKREGTPQPISWSEPPAGVVDPATAVAVVHTTARGFFAGKPVSLASIVESTRAQGSVVLDLVSRLVDAGVLHRITTGDEPGNVTLALPPERITVRSVLELGYDLVGPPEQEGVVPGVRARLRDAHLQAAGPLTIADLLTSTATPLSPAPHAQSAPLTANKAQPETPPPSSANPYSRTPTEDTLPSQVEGAPDREQESPKNGVGNGDPVRRPLHDPGVL